MAHHVGDRRWDDIRCDTDDTDSTHRQKGKGERVIAGEDLKSRRKRIAKLVDPLDGTAGLLDGDDIFAIGGEPECGFHADLDAAASRNAVKDDGNLHGFGDGFEMAVEALLARLVVVGGHEQGGIRPGFLGGAGE